MKPDRIRNRKQLGSKLAPQRGNRAAFGKRRKRRSFALRLYLHRPMCARLCKYNIILQEVFFFVKIFQKISSKILV